MSVVGRIEQLEIRHPTRSYRLEAVLVNLANQIAMAWQSGAQPLCLQHVLAHRPLGVGGLAASASGSTSVRKPMP